MWKTVEIGSYKSADEILEALITGGFRVNERAAEVLERIPVSGAGTKIETSLLRVGDFGFMFPARYDRLCERVKERTPNILQAIVAPYLRLQYREQPIGEYIIVIMEPVSDLDYLPAVFSVENIRGEGLQLNAYCGEYDYLWVPETRILVAR